MYYIKKYKTKIKNFKTKIKNVQQNISECKEEIKLFNTNKDKIIKLNEKFQSYFIKLKKEEKEFLSHWKKNLNINLKKQSDEIIDTFRNQHISFNTSDNNILEKKKSQINLITTQTSTTTFLQKSMMYIFATIILFYAIWFM